METNETTVVVLGASAKPDRYSNKAFCLLVKKGFNVIPVNPAGIVINGVTALKSLSEIDCPVDTLTLYLNPERTDMILDDILKLAPRRIIMNPGTENPRLVERCDAVGIETLEACTLVLLSLGSF